MRDLISGYRTFITARIGRCGKCMQQSLAAAVALWGSFGIGLLIWPYGLAQGLIGLSAFGLTALWLLHVTVYAASDVAGARSADEQPPVRGRTSTALARGEPGAGHAGRRHALGLLLRAAGVGVIASLPVTVWPSAAFAFCGQCTKNDQCGVGWSCKNTAAVNSGEVCNECVKDS